MRFQLASLSLLALALPAFADGPGTIKVGPATGEPVDQRPVRTGVTRVDGKAPARPRRLKPGEVLFHLENADLATTVLPLLEQQAGVKLSLQANSRPVTLRLVEPVDWETALELVCQFANVHVTKDHTGKVVVRDSYGGSFGSRENWNDIAGTLSADAMSRLDARREAAQSRRAANYHKIRARQADYNRRSKFRGTSAVGGFGWRGGGIKAQYSRGQYSRGQYARAPRARGTHNRGTYSRGTHNRGTYSRGTRNRGTYSRGTRTRGIVQRGQYSRGQRVAPNRVRGTYSRGNRAGAPR